jgi:NAD(P)-dependent dehydrogenase (short-subunit alcohol dehydrogenase family)
MSPSIAPQEIDLTGKIALVTGGNAGMGAEIALRFAQAGADVALCGLHPAPELCEQISALGRRALSFQTDVADPQQVQDLFDEITRQWAAVDILVNNAGIYPMASLLEMTPEQWDQTLDIDLKAVFLCTQAAARGMVQAGKGGAIVNIASIEATQPAPNHSHYATAKAGVVMLTKAAALELGPHGIRVNAVSPGLMGRPTLAADWPSGYNSFLQRAPLGRVGEPVDIAAACVFLASPAAAWISGANLVVDGGVLCTPAF